MRTLRNCFLVFFSILLLFLAQHATANSQDIPSSGDNRSCDGRLCPNKPTEKQRLSKKKISRIRYISLLEMNRIKLNFLLYAGVS